MAKCPCKAQSSCTDAKLRNWEFRKMPIQKPKKIVSHLRYENHQESKMMTIFYIFLYHVKSPVASTSQHFRPPSSDSASKKGLLPLPGSVQTQNDHPCLVQNGIPIMDDGHHNFLKYPKYSKKIPTNNGSGHCSGAVQKGTSRRSFVHLRGLDPFLEASMMHLQGVAMVAYQ